MTAPAQGVGADGRVLHVLTGYEGFHLVSPETIAEAEAAQEAADSAPYYEGFGELRRSGDLEMLSNGLDNWGLDLESYVAAIEQSAGRVSGGGDLDKRLAALQDVDFDGDDGTPADSDDFRSDSELDNEVEDRFAVVLSEGMTKDVPADVLQAFATTTIPMFGDHTLCFVTAEHLDEMVSVLTTRGFTVISD